MVNESKCLLLFPWCGVSRVITLLIATSAWQTSEDFLEKISLKFPTLCASEPLNQFPATQICQYLSLQLKRKIPCLLINVRVPVLKVRRIVLNQIPPFNISLRHPSSIRNAWITCCVICIYPKRKQKFWGPGSHSGIYWNQEQPFRHFVLSSPQWKACSLLCKCRKYVLLQRYRWVDDRTGAWTKSCLLEVVHGLQQNKP